MGYDKYIFLYYQVVEIDESVFDNLFIAESIGELVIYFGFLILLFLISFDGYFFVSVLIIDNDDDDFFSYFRIIYVQLVNIKVEFFDDNEDVEQVCIRLVFISL